MIIFGINDSSHDASLSVLGDGEILFAAHSERYNKEKNTYWLSPELVDQAFEFGIPDVIAYFERRSKKRLRRAIYGGVNGDYKNLYRRFFGEFSRTTEIQVNHHKSHAAAGFFTSKFDDATIVVIDAIGEFETASAWHGTGNNLTMFKRLKYPVSFGLFYSAYTHLLGLKPGTEEYILMGMSAYGDKSRFLEDVNSSFPKYDVQPYSFHKGVRNWNKPVDDDQSRFDVAAAVQDVFETRLMEFMTDVRRESQTGNLVFMGGCALNCLANRRLYELWDNIWIMPNPGDAGSSLGAALSVHGSHVEWTGPYLGHNIDAPYPVDQVLSSLLENKIAGVAVGRAEFGPRALGNRSLFADPRDPDIKSIVNKVKRREEFRPFAPVILAEHASEWFGIKGESPYMQFAVRCRKPDLIPSVVHVDGTSRVQTVTREQHPGLYDLLVRWKEKTGIPVLLNTSLNIKNQPLINDASDARAWQVEYPDVPIFYGQGG